MTLLYLNGSYVAGENAVVSAFDRGFLYGDGIFETVKILGEKPFRLEEHLARLGNSAQFLSIPVPEADFEGIISRLADENCLPDGAARITLTRGSSPLGPSPGCGELSPTLLVSVRPLPSDLFQKASRGVSLKTLPWPLRSPGHPLNGHKTLNYLSSVLALSRVSAGEEPLMQTTGGHVSEAASSNVFWRIGEEVFTPSLETGCLPGLMRARVIALLEKSGQAVSQGCYPLEMLKTADEAFLTNAVVGVLPVTALDGTGIGNGQPGPLSARLSRLVWEETAP